MGDFLLVGRPAGDPATEALSAELSRLASAEGFEVTELNAHAWLATRGPHPPRVRRIGGWTLIGDVLDRRAPVLPGSDPADPFDYERKLLARFWGRFVGVLFGPGDQPTAVLRDPSGALECVVWMHGGLTFAASSALDWLIRRLRPAWRINYARVADALRDPLSAAGPLMLDGPTPLLPGTVQPLPLPMTAHTLWRPADIAAASLDDRLPLDDAAVLLRRSVDEAVEGLGGLSAPVAAEISGGLDSSIVAASLVTADVPVALWINAFGDTPEADERSYVQSLAEALAIVPTCVPHARGPVTEAMLEGANADFRPGLNAMDAPHDRDWADRFRAAGATAAITGKGGDSILLQQATPDVFADLWRARGWRALLHEDVARLAAANETSVWAMVRRARLHDRDGHRQPLRDAGLLAPREEAPPPHPWTRDCDAFGPAKFLQILGVADSVSRHGPSLVTEAVDVRHPLCAQPVIEAGLALPAPLLTTGGRSRGLARQAFADRLPVAISERRSKGDMTRIYGRMIVDNLTILRAWLMEGRLAANGVIDPSAADQELTRERFLWRGKYSAIMVAAAFEAWARVWERRLAPISTKTSASPRAR